MCIGNLPEIVHSSSLKSERRHWDLVLVVKIEIKYSDDLGMLRTTPESNDDDDIIGIVTSAPV